MVCDADFVCDTNFVFAAVLGMVTSEEGRQELEQIHGGLVFTPNLAHGARFRRFVRTPTQEFCAVPESTTGEVIELHFHHQLILHRFPFR